MRYRRRKISIPRNGTSCEPTVPDATVFQGRAWLTGWLDAFAPAPERVRIFAAFDGARLVGLAPLVRDEDAPTWRFVADDYSDYQTFLAWDCSPQILDSLLEAIDAALPSGDSVLLNDLPQFSALALLLADRARSVSSGIEPGSWIVCPALNVSTNPPRRGARLTQGQPASP